MIPKSGNRFSEKIMRKQNASMPERPGGKQPAAPSPMLARRRPIGQNSLSIWAKA
jgi:hypothetical protein